MSASLSIDASEGTVADINQGFIACYSCRSRKRACQKSDDDPLSCVQCLSSESVCVWPERDKRRRVERGERTAESGDSGRPRGESGEQISAPGRRQRRRSSSKLVKHEDNGEARDKESRGNGHQDYEDDYGSDSSEGDIDVPLSAHHNTARQPSVAQTAGSVQASYSADYLSADNRSNGNGIGSSHQAFAAARRVSFGQDVNGGGSNGMSITPLQGSQGPHQSDQSHQSHYQPHSLSQQSYGNQVGVTYANGMQPAHTGSFPQTQAEHHSHNQYSQGGQQPHLQAHHAESSVRFIPGLLSAVHGETPTPSPPNGYRPGNGAQQQSNGNIDPSQQQRSHHLSMMSSAPGLASTLASFTSASGARPSSGHGAEHRASTSQAHGQPYQAVDGRHLSESHPLSLAHATSHGLVSSGYNISISTTNGMRDGSARHGSEYDGIQNRAGEKRVGSNAWMSNDTARPSVDGQPHLHSSATYDADTGIVRRDYAGLNPHISADGNAIGNDPVLAGSDDIGKDVGPGVGSSNSGGTSASLKALKMDLGEEGHDAANE